MSVHLSNLVEFCFKKSTFEVKIKKGQSSKFTVNGQVHFIFLFLINLLSECMYNKDEISVKYFHKENNSQEDVPPNPVPTQEPPPNPHEEEKENIYKHPNSAF